MLPRRYAQVVLEKRGDWLMQDDRCPEAALCEYDSPNCYWSCIDRPDCMTAYTMAGQPRKAMIAYQRALNWVELFALASQVQLAEQDMITLAENVASECRLAAKRLTRIFTDLSRRTAQSKSSQ